MNRDDDQQLWDLLGKASSPELSPFFARHVVRKIREGAETRKAGIWHWLTPGRLVPLTGALAALVIGVAVFHGPARKADVQPLQSANPPTLAMADIDDSDVAADLDDLVGGDDDDTVTL